MSFRDYYADLNVHQTATIAQIRAAFHALARKHHPDKTGDIDSTVFRRVREAYEKLSDAKFRAEYDCTYSLYRMSFEPDDPLTGTRTEAYEAEDAEEGARASPSAETCGASHTTYVEANQGDICSEMLIYDSRSETRIFKAHGLQVNMTSHPAVSEGCTIRSQKWDMPHGGTDVCIFCLKLESTRFRCPGCEALACSKCLRDIVMLERVWYAGSGSRFYYMPCGG